MNQLSVLLICILFADTMHSQVLYDNGNIVNFPGQGSNGADASVVFTGGIATGADHIISGGTKVADDFTVSSSGWKIDSIVVFAYALNSGTTSPMTDLRLTFWNGHPAASGTIVWGSESKNVLARTTFSGAYRVLESNETDTKRPIMRMTANVGGTVLQEGTYWMVWQAASAGFSGPYAPPLFSTVAESTGNASQYFYDVVNSGWKWSDIKDAGLGDIQLGMPFIIYGSFANGLHESLSGQDVKVYPNPCKGETTISISPLLSNRKGELRMFVFNRLGHQVKIEHILSPNFALHLETLSSGIYFYKLYSSEELLKTGKLLIE